MAASIMMLFKVGTDNLVDILTKSLILDKRKRLRLMIMPQQRIKQEKHDGIIF